MPSRNILRPSAIHGAIHARKKNDMRLEVRHPVNAQWHPAAGTPRFSAC
jgi:hypothetical protein